MDANLDIITATRLLEGNKKLSKLFFKCGGLPQKLEVDRDDDCPKQNKFP